MRNLEFGVKNKASHLFRIPNSSGVPWPIALLTLLYGLIATASAVSCWKAAAGLTHQAPAWPLAWLAVSAGATIGLPLLKPWGRGLAVCTSALLLAVTLAIAGVFVAAGRPLAGLLATGLAGTHALIIRYLQRPMVKAWFVSVRSGHGSYLLR